MTDLLGIGASGVAAYRTALGVVGDNVANADTPGYVRRKVVLRETSVGAAGTPLDRTIPTGSGARVASIGRASDVLKANAARNAAGDLARIDARAEWLTRLQTALGTGDASLSTQIGGFFDAAQDLASSPASMAARTIFLDRADQTASAFRATSAALDGVAGDIKAATADAVAQVNRLTTNLAAINRALKLGNGDLSNGLLDERDRALAELGTYLRVGTTDTGRGTIEVRAGDGPDGAVLVGGGTATRIDVGDGPGGAELILHPTHAPATVRLPASGSLAGLVEAGRRTAATIVSVDALATRFATAANAQHEAGVDADGDDGTPLFATRTLGVTAGAANGGAATVDLRIADGATIGDGYTLGFDGSVWTLARADGSGAVAGTGPLTLDGVTVTGGGAALAGDRFALAARDGAAGLALRPLDAREVAAADRWLGDADGQNLGIGRLTVMVDLGATGLPPLTAYRIVVTGAASADIVDPATSAVLATAALDGMRVAGAGFAFTLGGTPAIGDTFRIARNVDGIGDNGNVRALVALRAQGGSGGTIEATIDAVGSGLASTLSETSLLAASARAVRDDAARAADAASGVDLDQEAAELTRLQAAYKANAQVIAAARELFDSLLQAVS